MIKESELAKEIYEVFFKIADPLNDAKFKDNMNRKLNAKECSYIALDMLINESKLHDTTIFQQSRTGYWTRIKKEIEKI